MVLGCGVVCGNMEILYIVHGAGGGNRNFLAICGEFSLSVPL